MLELAGWVSPAAFPIWARRIAKSGGLSCTVSQSAIRLLGELRALGLPVDHIDAGGGLGVDLRPALTITITHSSINYDVNGMPHTVRRHVRDFM